MERIFNIDFKDKIIRDMMFLIVLFFVSIGIIVVFGFAYEQYKMKTIQSQIDNIHQKRELLSIMNVKIKDLKSQINIYKTTRFETDFISNGQQYRNSLLQLQKLVNVLQNGGTYIENIQVNSQFTNDSQLSITYKKIEDCKCSTIKQVDPIINELLKVDEKIQALGYQSNLHNGILDIYIKESEAYFTRLEEVGNAASVNLYTMLLERRDHLNRNSTVFEWVKNLIVVLILLLMLYMARKVFRKIKKILHNLEAFVEKNEYLTQAIEESPVSFVITNTKGEIEYVNSYFTQQTGYSKEEAIGANPKILKTGILPQQFYANLWSTIQSGKVWKGEFCNQNKLGEIYWEQAVIAPLKNAKGEIVNYVSIKENVTEKRKLKNSLKENTESLQAIIDNLPVGIIILNQQKQILSINPEAARILKYNSLSEANQHIVNQVCHNCITRTQEKQCPIFDLGQKSYALQERKMSGKLGDIMVLKSAIPIKINDDELLLEAFMDITEQKNAGQKEKEANLAKSKFLANMSHELRTPLNGIIGSVEILKSMELNSEQQQIFSIIQTSGENLLNIINDILDFSKIEANKIVLESISFNINELIEQVVRQFSYKSNETHVELLYRIAPDVPENIVGDRVKLTQILVNLIGNAFKFTKEGEILLDISVEKKNQSQYSLIFSIEDSGIGIPLEKQKHIFDPFTQADSSTTRQFGGTGLGTTISKNFVELMGGQIQVISPNPRYEPNQKGSIFRFNIQTHEDITLPKTVFVHKKPKVAIVHNHRLSSHILNEKLNQIGIESDMIKTDLNSIKQIDFQPYDCVLIDWDYKILDINKLMENITINTKIILLSSVRITNENITNSDKISSIIYKPLIFSEFYKIAKIIINSDVEIKSKPIQEVKFFYKVLLVEDNEFNQKVGKKLLEQIGCTVSLAENGEIAIDKAFKENFDVIFMDVQMPVMNGLDATMWLRQKDCKVPIVAMTANATIKDREICLEAGMNNFLSKPFRKEELISILNTLRNNMVS